MRIVNEMVGHQNGIDLHPVTHTKHIPGIGGVARKSETGSRGVILYARVR